MSFSRQILLVNYLNVSRLTRRFAGHSKWANIKHIKAVKDAEKGSLFTKLSRQMKVAIQEHGSPNPNVNLRLAQIIERAKKLRMPVASIENVIKATQLNKNNCKSIIVEIKAQNGVMVLCELFTDNYPGCKMKLATILKKSNASFSDGGGKYLFSKKGLIETIIPDVYKDNPNFEEMSVEHAIEVGAEEVNKISEDSYIFLCEDIQLKHVETALLNLKYDILNAEIEFLPNMYVSVPEAEAKKVLNLLEKLENSDDVVRLYHNLEL